MIRSFTEDVVREHMQSNSSLWHIFQTDAQSKTVIEMLKRYGFALEEACKIHGVEPDLAEKLIRTMILGSLPSVPDANARVDLSRKFHDHLEGCTMPMSFPTDLFPDSMKTKQAKRTRPDDTSPYPDGR